MSKKTLPEDSNARKNYPIAEGVLFYFPAALAMVARVSKKGNDKHNPGADLHHARGKSMDHADCIMRHLIDSREGDGCDADGIPEVAYAAWRALALCQEWLEQNRDVPLAPNARDVPPAPNARNVPLAPGVDTHMSWESRRSKYEDDDII